MANIKKNRKWYIIDAENKSSGRIATEAAIILQGKHKPDYTPHLDMGDAIIIINAEKIKITGEKMADKKYYRHSGNLGNLKAIPVEKMMEKKPTEVLKLAIFGMLPKTRHRSDRINRLKIFVGPEHSHDAQKPITLKIKD